MKKFSVLALVLALFGASLASAAITTDQKYELNNRMGGVANRLQLGTLLDKAEQVNYTSTLQVSPGTMLKRVAKAYFDTSDTGYGSSTVDSGVHGLGVYLPGGATITRSWIYVVEQFVDSGSGTVAFHCEDANNIKTATDLTGTAAGGFIEGASTGTAASMVGGIAADCEIKATVGGVDLSAGKASVFVEYVIGQSE